MSSRFKRLSSTLLLRHAGSSNWLLPVAGSVILHLLLIAGFFVVLPSAEERRVSPAPTYVSAKMVELAPRVKPKPKKVVRKSAPKKVKKPKAVRPKPKKIATPKPKKKTVSLPEKKIPKPEPASTVKDDEALKKEQELRDREFEQLLAREERARQQAAQAKADSITVAGYKQVVASLVASQWSRPPSARRGMIVELKIRMIPTGEVIEIALVKSSGNEAFDNAAIHAVDRASPFREIQGMESRIFEKNFREFRFVFNPEDLLE